MNKKEKIICWIIVFRPVLLAVGGVITVLLINRAVIMIWKTDKLLFEGDYLWTTIFQLFIAVLAARSINAIIIALAGIVIIVMRVFDNIREWSLERYQAAVKTRKIKQKAK